MEHLANPGAVVEPRQELLNAVLQAVRIACFPEQMDNDRGGRSAPSDRQRADVHPDRNLVAKDPDIEALNKLSVASRLCDHAVGEADWIPAVVHAADHLPAGLSQGLERGDAENSLAGVVPKDDALFLIQRKDAVGRLGE